LFDHAVWLDMLPGCLAMIAGWLNMLGGKASKAAYALCQSWLFWLSMLAILSGYA
jgi:hypothetical protein